MSVRSVMTCRCSGRAAVAERRRFPDPAQCDRRAVPRCDRRRRRRPGGSGAASRLRDRRWPRSARSGPRCCRAAARSGTLPCWRTARRTCVWRSWRGERCRRRWSRGSRVRRSTWPGRRAGGRHTGRADRQPASSSDITSHPCALWYQAVPYPITTVVHRSTKRSSGESDDRSHRRHERRPPDRHAAGAARVPRIPAFLQGLGFSRRAQVDGGPDRPPVRRRLHPEAAGLRPHGDRRRPGAGQAVVHGQHRRRRQHPAQPLAGCWARDRCSRSTAPTIVAAASCSPRRSTARASRTTSDLRRGDAARGGESGPRGRRSRPSSR